MEGMETGRRKVAIYLLEKGDFSAHYRGRGMD